MPHDRGPEVVCDPSQVCPVIPDAQITPSPRGCLCLFIPLDEDIVVLQPRRPEEGLLDRLHFSLSRHLMPKVFVRKVSATIPADDVHALSRVH
jgi:hypothetical protein